MEGIRGKCSYDISRADILKLAAGSAGVLVDLGTGDGRFVAQVARAQPDWLAIGVDACRENLREHSRRAPANALYAVANALFLPDELAGMAKRVTINFPWGSLLGGLLSGDRGLLDGILMLTSPGTDLRVRLNADALAEQGWGLLDGVERIAGNLAAAGFSLRSREPLDGLALRAVPTTWARRLAHGRNPRGYVMRMERNQACALTHASSSASNRAEQDDLLLSATETQAKRARQSAAPGPRRVSETRPRGPPRRARSLGL